MEDPRYAYPLLGEYLGNPVEDPRFILHPQAQVVAAVKVPRYGYLPIFPPQGGDIEGFAALGQLLRQLDYILNDRRSGGVGAGARPLEFQLTQIVAFKEHTVEYAADVR